jgi:hypothetical protein
MNRDEIIKEFLSQAGKKGGSVKSERKARASRENGKLGGRPKRRNQTMNKKEQAMREEAREAIIEALQNGYSGYYCDLHNEVFNTDYYIIGTYKAKEALKEYDVFEALEKVQTYEEENFGEVYTDLSDPEKLINMLYYIIGEEVLFEMMDGIKIWDENWNNQANEETNAEILKAIEE